LISISPAPALRYVGFHWEGALYSSYALQEPPTSSYSNAYQKGDSRLLTSGRRESGVQDGRVLAMVGSEISFIAQVTDRIG